jgi:hypothetical protein
MILAGETGIAMRAANLEAAGGIDQKLVQYRRRQHRLDDFSMTASASAFCRSFMLG